MVMSPARAGSSRREHVWARLRLRSFWPRQRVRRPVDMARLVLAAAATVALVLCAALAPGVLGDTAALLPTGLSGLPRNLLSVANVLASLAVLGALLALAVDAVRSRRFALTAAVLAWLLAVAAALALALAAGMAEPVARTLLIGTPHRSAALPVVTVVALLVGSDLHAPRWRGRARLALGVAAACALALGSLTLPSAAFALLVGTTAGLAVRAAVGVVPARPPEAVVRSVLAEAGWPLTALCELEQGGAGRVRYEGEDADGSRVQLTVVDPDRQGIPFAQRAWRMLRFRTAAVGRPALSLRGHLEQQALSGALAESAGVATPRVLALLPAGPALVLLERPLEGAPLRRIDGPAAARGAAAAMTELRRLHSAGLAHGALTPDRVVLLPDGRAGFTGLVVAQPAATELQRELDVVALLVSAARQVGAAEAVTALRTGYGTGPTTDARFAALLQPLALPAELRREVRGTSVLDELRTALAGRAPGGAVAAPRLQRLRARTVISVAAGTLAAHILATQLSKVSIGSALAQAQPGWLAVALAGSAVTYLGSGLALQAFVTTALPLRRTTLVQVASSFVTLVTPPGVGHVGLNIRYLQRAGVPLSTATASVAVKEAVTVAVTVPLLLVCGWLSGVSASRLTLLPSGNVLAVLLVAAAAIALLVAAPPTRRLLRRRLDPLLRRTLPQLVAAASSPRRMATAVAGIVLLNGGYVLALAASLQAFGYSLPVPTLVVVYLAASALGSAAPTPGGLGAVEAALVAGLTATGIPVAAALTAVLAFRTATFWLPAPVGWGAFLSLQRHGRI